MSRDDAAKREKEWKLLYDKITEVIADHYGNHKPNDPTVTMTALLTAISAVAHIYRMDIVTVAELLVAMDGGDKPPTTKEDPDALSVPPAPKKMVN